MVVIFGAERSGDLGPVADRRRSGARARRASRTSRSTQVLDALQRAAGGGMKQLLRLLSYGRKYWPQLLVSVILMALAGAAQGTVPLLIQPIFDRVLVPNAPGGPIAAAAAARSRPPVLPGQLRAASRGSVWTMVAIALLLAFLIKGVCDYVGNYLISYAGFASVTRPAQCGLRQGAASRARNSSRRTPPGQLMSSIMNDVDKVQVATSQILADLLRQFFAAVLLLFVLFSNDWRLALVCLMVLPAVMLPTMRMGRRIRRTSRRTQDRQAELNQILQETLSGHMVVKAFGAEEYESRRFREASHRLLKTNVRYVLQQALSSPLIDFCAALTIVGLLTYARTQIKAGAFTAGDFTSFLIALLMLLEPLKRLVGIYNIFQQALGASQKVFEYLDHQETVVEKRRMRPKLAGFRKDIVFDNVAFHYPGAPDGFRIQGLNLEVKAGEVVALVGPSGGGKTTLANLVPRFYDVTGGQRPDRRPRRARASAWRACARRSASWRRTRSCSTTRWPTTSPTAATGVPARGDPRGRRNRAGARIHHAAAGGLRDRDRRPRREALRRPAAAPGDRARAAEERAHPDSGRSHLPSRHRVRNAGTKGAGQPDGAPHRDRDRAPAFDHPPGR